GTENGITAGLSGTSLFVYSNTPTQTGTAGANLDFTGSIIGASAITNISVVGSSGNDIVFETPGASPGNVYGTGPNAHSLNAITLPTTVDGGAGPDSLVGGSGADTLTGAAGDDTRPGGT